MERGAVVRLSALLVLAAVMCVSPAVADEPPITAQAALGTGFTYQGRLADGGVPATGTYDFLFRLYDGADPATAAQVGADLPLEDVAVTNGLFTVTLDFGTTPFTGQALWLQVSVRPGASADAHTALSPLTAITGAPYALSLMPGATVTGGSAGAILEAKNAQASGFAIRGWATAASGQGVGIFGRTDSPNGYAGWFWGGRNYFQGRVGIGSDAAVPTNQLHVTASISGGATLTNHVALIENTSTGTSADVLALKIGTAHSSVGGSNNFITFFDAGTNTLGSVQARNDGSGVEFGSNSEDYAEWLPRLDESEAIEPGDIVGVFAGSVSKATADADQLLVVSTAPIVAAGDPGEEERDAYELVAFLGQVPVRVRGTVTAGDFVIPSGLGDGTGVAVSPEVISVEEFAQVVGQAWESSADAGLKSVNVVVGLAQRDPTLARLVGETQALQARVADIEARLAALEGQ